MRRSSFSRSSRRRASARSNDVSYREVHTLCAGGRHGVGSVSHDCGSSPARLIGNKTAEAEYIALEYRSLVHLHFGHSPLQDLPELVLGERIWVSLVPTGGARCPRSARGARPGRGRRRAGGWSSSQAGATADLARALGGLLGGEGLQDPHDPAQDRLSRWRIRHTPRMLEPSSCGPRCIAEGDGAGIDCNRSNAGAAAVRG